MFRINKSRPCFKFERWAELYFMQNGCSNVERNVVYTVKNKKNGRFVGRFQIDVQYTKLGLSFSPLLKKIVPVEVKNRNVNKRDVEYFHKKMNYLDAKEGELLTSREIDSDAYFLAKKYKIEVKGPEELSRTKITKGITLEEQIKNISEDYSAKETHRIVYV